MTLGATAHPGLAMSAARVIRNVERNDRRALGASVTLERFNAELPGELLAHSIIEIVTADRDEAQVLKIVRSDVVQNRGQQSRSRRYQRHMLRAAQGAQFALADEISAVGDARAGQCRQ